MNDTEKGLYTINPSFNPSVDAQSEVGVYKLVDHETATAIQETRIKYEYRIKWYQFVIALIIFCSLAVGLILGLEVYTPKSTTGFNIFTNKASTNTSIKVFYAGSLKDILTRVINPKYTDLYGISVVAIGAGSGSLATRLQQGEVADVFISADDTYNTALLKSNIPGRDIKISSWYTYWTSTRLGLGYSINSPFRSPFSAIENGSIPWYKALDKSIMKIGRTDPMQDPKGDR
eukprot:gene9721-20215_t